MDNAAPSNRHDRRRSSGNGGQRKAQHSRVHHASTPAGEFTIIPNSLIRDPAIKPGMLSVIAWFASQAEGRTVYLAKLGEEVGMSPKTARKALLDALLTPYLSRTPTGGRDHQGNETYLYTVDLVRLSTATNEPRGDSPYGRGENLPTKKIIEKTNAKTLPATSVAGLSNIDHNEGNRSVSSTTTASTRQTIKQAGWQVKPRHLRKLEAYHFDDSGQEVYQLFMHMFNCPYGCPTAPKSSSWDAKFSSFIDAYMEDREEIEFHNHMSEAHYDEEGQAV